MTLRLENGLNEQGIGARVQRDEGHDSDATEVPCQADAMCLWCFTTNNCTEYPVSWLLPPASVCQLSQARWGVCW
ncbi:Pituitary tumor-transforming gene 1 protein-interacting protein, partial [Nibea albiflora]